MIENRRCPIRLLAALALVLCLGAAICVRAHASPQVPDVVVLVVSGQTPEELVSVTYAGRLSRAAVESDLAALKKASGWIIRDLRISTRPIQTGGPAMTGAEFVTPFIIDRATGILPIEPFLVALRNHKIVEIDYIVQGNFNFQGPRTFSNKYVDIAFDQTSNSYRYRAIIKDRRFDRLNVPIVAPQVQTPDAEESRRKPGGRLTALRTMLAIGIAVLIGLAVYLFSNRLWQRDGKAGN